MATQAEERVNTLDWEDATATEIAVTGHFISRHGGQVHHGLGGSPQLDIATGQCAPLRPYLQLEDALRFYIPNMLRLQMPESTTSRMWNDLSEKIGLMEKQCKETKNGLWHSLWHKMGQKQEAAEAWMAFIPDEYGLGVVKAGLALVFKLAEASAEKQQRIYDTFAALRDTLIQAQPERRSFRANQQVNDAVDRLYQCVVDSIHDIAAWIAAEDKSTWNKVTSKFKRHRETASVSPCPEEILQTLEEHTKAFRDALGIARD
ncbi:hypothetical protein NEMBOFW57_006777 [Staphylotrichum longicolle]|uniref:Uncharacterized protein n=1 Tax=Staphylotrichum longicolle TaxID=669026 RepID=A0AAD4EU81_9PEZI|nr:hypothetical protein NEMBOFW57_006777 [Staphylotrichum longicolle]